MKSLYRNLTIFILMLTASGLALAIRPSHMIAAAGPKVNLAGMIPQRFGDWRLDEKLVYQQVSPDLQAALDRIYTQVLTRTYVNSQGYRIMLMIPYGADQSDALSAHDPEGCYPAQGFQILSKRQEILKTSAGEIPVRRMEASSGDRHEPVTYWFTVGYTAVNNDWARKKVQMRYTLRGEIPDGLLVRVSSIDRDTMQAYKTQTDFVEAMVMALSTESRKRMAGL